MKKILSLFIIILIFVPSISYANKWHIKMKKQEKKDFAHYVLKAQSDNKMVFNLRNIKNSNIYKFFDKFGKFSPQKTSLVIFLKSTSKTVDIAEA